MFLEALLTRPNVTALPFDQGLYGHARRAFEHYGRASGHPAKLNFGDCMAYAVAKASSVPLLYKGNGFAKTDIVSAFS